MRAVWFCGVAGIPSVPGVYTCGPGLCGQPLCGECDGTGEVIYYDDPDGQDFEDCDACDGCDGTGLEVKHG